MDPISILMSSFLSLAYKKNKIQETKAFWPLIKPRASLSALFLISLSIRGYELAASFHIPSEA